MEVLARNGPKALFKEFKKHVMPEGWNYLVRPAGIYGGSALGIAGFSGLCGMKFAVEHSLKAGWYGTKLLAHVPYGLYDITCARTRIGAPPPTYPRLDRWSFPGAR